MNIIAKYFKSLKSAEKEVENRRKYSKSNFVILKSKQGYLVVSERQLDLNNPKELSKLCL